MRTDRRHLGTRERRATVAQSLVLALWLASTLIPSVAVAATERFEATPIGRGELVFHRSGRGDEVLEGFVVDSEKLVTTLKARVLGARGLGAVANISLGTASTQRGGAGQISAAPDRAYEFTHRFALPFDSITATLRLAPLEEPDEGLLLQYLGLGLAAAIIGGLFALYRMAATQVIFAERRSNFVSAVSHELKTPLTAIRMYAEMLQEGLVEDEQKQHEYARTITSESERLTRLINNVLALSRIEQQQRLALRSDDPRPIIREVVDVLRPHAAREGFTIELELPDELPDVLFEPDALRQVLFNLIDNSLKYAKESADRRVTVEARGLAEGGICLSVRDRGPGVPQELLDTIFEPFYRAERELTRTHEGCGIGLALVEGLVTGMRGSATAHRIDSEAEPLGLEIRVHLIEAGS